MQIIFLPVDQADPNRHLMIFMRLKGFFQGVLLRFLVPPELCTSHICDQLGKDPLKYSAMIGN